MPGPEQKEFEECCADALLRTEHLKGHTSKAGTNKSSAFFAGGRPIQDAQDAQDHLDDLLETIGSSLHPSDNNSPPPTLLSH